MKSHGISTWDIYRLAGEARLDPLTVLGVIEGRGRMNTRQQVIDAAKRLGIECQRLQLMALANGTRTRAT